MDLKLSNFIIVKPRHIIINIRRACTGALTRDNNLSILFRRQSGVGSCVF